VASAVPLVRLAVAAGRPAARVATLAVAAGRPAARVATLAVAAGAGANTVPRVLPGGRARLPTGQEQVEDLARRAIPRAGSPGGRPLAADQVAGLAGLAGRTIVRARATGLARPVSLAGPVRQDRVPGPAALTAPPRPAGRTGRIARVQVPGPAGPALQVRAAGPGGRAPARTRTDGGASRAQGRARRAGQVARTALSVGLGPRDGGTSEPMAHDPAAAGPRATTTRGSAGDQEVTTSGRARHKVTRAALTGVLGLPNADPTGQAGRGPAMTRAATTNPATGGAGLAPGLARAATTNPGTGGAGLAPGLARAAGHRPSRRQADGTRTGLPPSPVATGRTVAGQPDLAGHQE
jgi:hypothetical protein